jgi:hypothetical protein
MCLSAPETLEIYVNRRGSPSLRRIKLTASKITEYLIRSVEKTTKQHGIPSISFIAQR